MKSSTEDFSEIKKSITEELYTRATQSCIKSELSTKRPIPLKPLNFAVIKKELEERWDEPLNYPVERDDGCIDKSDKEVVFSRDIWNQSTDTPIVGKSNLGECSFIEKNVFKERVENDNENSNINLSPITEENENTQASVKNVSFDLDFSALPLHTPVKNTINNSLMNIDANSTKKYFEFVTPKVDSTTKQSFLAKKTHFNTPVNPVSRSLNSANKTIHLRKGSSELPMKEINDKNKENVTSQNSYSDTFKIIRVNKVEYIVFNLLGRGGSSEVYHCYNIETKCQVAIKCVSLQNSNTANGYINEVKLLQQLQTCDRIIKMYDYEIIHAKQKLIVVLEKSGEDLSTTLKRLAGQQSRLPMYMLLFYWMEMLYAVKQIHDHGIIHADLKPANFLKSAQGLKLIDFGIASSVQMDMTSVIKSVPEGSCNYISPEALNSESSSTMEKHSNPGNYKVHYKSDVWSLGCILYQLVYRRTPFQHITQLWAKLAAIINPNFKIDYPAANWVPPKIINTIRKCLQYDVRLRPSIDQLIVEYEAILNNI